MARGTAPYILLLYAFWRQLFRSQKCSIAKTAAVNGADVQLRDCFSLMAKEGEIEKAPAAVRGILTRLSTAITSVRQAAEWGTTPPKTRTSA